MLFQALWQINEKGLKIGLHHGSLATGQRRKTEAAMAAGKLDAVVATSSLDLGIDWAEIDLVMQVGAPKGSARLIQRMGRAGHRLMLYRGRLFFRLTGLRYLRLWQHSRQCKTHSWNGWLNSPVRWMCWPSIL